MVVNNDKMSNFKKVDCCIIFCDICNNLSKSVLITVLFIAVLASLLSYYYGEAKCNNYEMFVNVSSTLMGFSLAAFAILIGSKEIMDKKNMIVCDNNKKIKPVEIIFADLAFGLIIQCVSILLFIIMAHIKCDSNFVKVSSLALMLSEILWSIHIIIHVYTLRTYIRPNQTNN